MGNDGVRQLSPLFTTLLVKWDGRSATYKISLDENLRRVLGELMEQMLNLLSDPEAPLLHRLFPPAYSKPVDLERQDEYRRLMQEDLVERRRGDCQTVIDSIKEEHLDEEKMMAWVAAINSMRLVLGTYLDVKEDDPPRQPESQEESAYLWLSFLLEESIDALSRNR